MSPILKNKNGFTLIELVVTIGVIAILAIIATPLINKTLPNYRLKSTARDLYSMFRLARVEAVKRNLNVVIVIDPEVYSPDGMAGSYHVFVDDGAGGGNAENFKCENPDGYDPSSSGTEEIIANVSMPKKVSLFNTNFAGTPQSIAFNNRGLPLKDSNLPLNDEHVLLRNTNRWYKITVSSAGHIKLEISSDGTNFSL